MHTSRDRILTTHVGSLPRTPAVTDVVFAKEHGTLLDERALDTVVADAVVEVVARQVRAGVDIVSDGELSKISYATYIKDRISGFAGDSPRRTPHDLEEFPAYMQQAASSGGTPTYSRPRCVGPLAPMSSQPLEDDLRRFREALKGQPVGDAFMNAASPGVIALFQPNDYYPTHEAYLEAIAEAMRPEYEAIVAAGYVLQIDSPDLGLGRHTMYKERAESEYVALATLHVEVLNHALRNVAADRVRMHVCWGNYEGPHHRDVAMSVVLPIALRAKPQGLLFEASNPRHAHEWTVFRDAAIPDDKILIPGVIDSVTNFVEHPLLVAERLCRFGDIVGRERVIAGTDCGFASFAGFGRVDAEIVYAKLATMAEGAALASKRLWGRSA
ncbi:MAG: cobalamin-independent methionine synthase II family protein [Chloroflexi bacterium]|nr:cobalamin-independent methionine synthase II family protein [Chloroflexota bacterium]